jgi:hypothetical protein
MNKIFKKISNKEFFQRFATEEACYAFLEERKWSQGFVCRKCGHDNYCKGKKDFSRRCTKCKHEESVTAHTVFHNSRLPITKAFQVLFTMCCHPETTAYKIAKDECMRSMTCWKLKKKIESWMSEKGDIVDTQQ